MAVEHDLIEIGQASIDKMARAVAKSPIIANQKKQYTASRRGQQGRQSSGANY